MIKLSIRKTTAILAVFLLIIVSFSSLNVTVSAQSELACEGLGGTCVAAPDSEPQITNVIAQALNILSFISGIIAVFMIIIAGVRFITSQGDPGKVSGARSAVIYALIGVVIVVMAQTIVFFILRASSTSAPAEEETTEIIKTIAYDKIM